MGAFEYAALDNRGRTRKGVLEGDTARQVRQQLREKGWSPMAVEEVAIGRKKPGDDKSPGFSRRFGITPTDLALITRQLATLVHSGLPLEEALKAVSQQTEKSRIQSMVLAVRSRVLEGHSMADGLGIFPGAFPELYRMTVAAGEQSGHLDVVLERLADYTESRQKMRQKVMLALLYPIILTLLAFGVVVGLLTYVVPEVVKVFVNTGQQLPWLTRTLIGVSDFLVANGFIILAIMAVLGIGWNYALRNDKVRYAYHNFLLRLPLIARLTRGINTARFARTLSILGSSGVPILEGLHVSSQVLGNLPMRAAVEEAALRVREGATLSASLNKSGYFTPMTIHLIASGEASGELENMLERAATNQEQEVETLIAALLGIFEPILILAMGGIVLVIVLAILLPIFELNQLVK